MQYFYDGAVFEPAAPPGVDQEEEAVSEEPAHMPAVENKGAAGEAAKYRVGGGLAHELLPSKLSIGAAACCRFVST